MEVKWIKCFGGEESKQVLGHIFRDGFSSIPSIQLFQFVKRETGIEPNQHLFSPFSSWSMLAWRRRMENGEGSIYSKSIALLRHLLISRRRGEPNKKSTLAADMDKIKDMRIKDPGSRISGSKISWSRLSGLGSIGWRSSGSRISGLRIEGSMI